jgi:hypothetical protein
VPFNSFTFIPFFLASELIHYLPLPRTPLGANRDFDKWTSVAASYWREAYEQYRIVVALEPTTFCANRHWRSAAPG